MVRSITLWFEDLISPFTEMSFYSWMIVLGFFIIEIAFISVIILSVF